MHTINFVQNFAFARYYSGSRGTETNETKCLLFRSLVLTRKSQMSTIPMHCDRSFRTAVMWMPTLYVPIIYF